MPVSSDSIGDVQRHTMLEGLVLKSLVEGTADTAGKKNTTS